MFDPWVSKIPWRIKWQPTTVLLPGKSHGQRSLAGYSPWGHKRVRHDLVIKQKNFLSGITCIFFLSIILFYKMKVSVAAFNKMCFKEQIHSF